MPSPLSNTKTKIGFGGVPYKPSTPTLPPPTITIGWLPNNNNHHQSVPSSSSSSSSSTNYSITTAPTNRSSSLSLSSPPTPLDDPLDNIYSPSVYSPETPQLPPIEPTAWDRDVFGVSEGGDTNLVPPIPLKIRKHEDLVATAGPGPGADGWTHHHHAAAQKLVRGRFDAEKIPKPSDDELERPYGGTKHFMMSHGLKYYDQADCDLRREILDQIRELEWQNRINAAREEFYRHAMRLASGHTDLLERSL